MDGWHRAESQLCCYVTLGTLLRLFGSLFPVFSSAPCTRESYAIIDNLCNVSDREYTLKKKNSCYCYSDAGNDDKDG